MFEKKAILNNDDSILGYEDKMKVHESGILHRAFSVFIFNDKNEKELFCDEESEKEPE